MAVKQTIAFIGVADESRTVLVKKLAKANYPLLFISNDGYRYQQLTDQIKSDIPNADIETTDCAKEGCWEADIIALFDNTTLEKELIERIKVVATQKIVICISNSDGAASVPMESRDLQQMLPNSKVIQLFHDPAGLELLVAGANQEAISFVSTIFENAGFIIKKSKMNKENNNELLCNIETGICEVPAMQSTSEKTDISSKIKPIRVLYFTDPICSSCWGIEPQLRKLKLEYGDYFDIEYRMGGLLAGWNTYGGSDVSKPNDVAVHWEEAGAHYEMPIDGDVWIENPLSSSYPPSIAFKAAQLQGNGKALDFLRRIKEMVFLEKKNIEKWENLEAAASQTGLDVKQLKIDFEGKGKEMFDQDLALAGQLGVRGFPTIFFTDEDDNRFKVYGSKPYESYEQALLKLYPQANKKPIDTAFENIFSQYPTITSKEFGVLTNRSKDDAEKFLNGLYKQEKIGKYVSKNGVLWTTL